MSVRSEDVRKELVEQARNILREVNVQELALAQQAAVVAFALVKPERREGKYSSQSCRRIELKQRLIAVLPRSFSSEGEAGQAIEEALSAGYLGVSVSIPSFPDREHIGLRSPGRKIAREFLGIQ